MSGSAPMQMIGNDVPTSEDKDAVALFLNKLKNYMDSTHSVRFLDATLQEVPQTNTSAQFIEITIGGTTQNLCLMPLKGIQVGADAAGNAVMAPVADFIANLTDYLGEITYADTAGVTLPNAVGATFVDFTINGVTQRLCIENLKGVKVGVNAAGEDIIAPVTDSIADLEPYMSLPPVMVPDSAFALPAAPTEAEAATWIAANHPDDPPERVFYVVGTGTVANPSMTLESNGAGGSIVTKCRKPDDKILIPNSAFASEAQPTTAEALAWANANHPNAVAGQKFVMFSTDGAQTPVDRGDWDEGDINNPDVIWEKDGSGALCRVHCRDWANYFTIDSNYDGQFRHRFQYSLKNGTVSRQCPIIDFERFAISGSPNIVLNGQAQFDAAFAAGPVKILEIVDFYAPFELRPIINIQMHVRGILGLDANFQSTVYTQTNEDQLGVAGGLAGHSGPLVWDSVGNPTQHEDNYGMTTFGPRLQQGLNTISLWWNMTDLAEYNGGRFNINQCQLSIGYPVMRFAADCTPPTWRETFGA